MSYEAKTNWQLNDTVLPTDMNRIEQGVKNLDSKFLETDTTVYVATTGSDVTGNGTESTPYATIEKALSTVPSNLGGHTFMILIVDGTYVEDVVIKGISNGYIRLQRNGVQELNSLCNVKSIRVENCNSVSISGLNLTTTDTAGIFGTRTDFINVSSCQSVSNANTQVSFNFDYVSVVRISGNRSLNHNICLRAYASDVYSEHWSADSIGSYGIFLEGSAKISRGNAFQPRGTVANENIQSGGIISSKYGAVIGTLSNDTTLYVATTGSDTTGDGTSAKPFKTIQHAVDILPKDLNGYSAYIIVSNGTYNEDLLISGFHSGMVSMSSNSPESINTDVAIKSVVSIFSDAYIKLSGLYIYGSSSNGASVTISACKMASILYTLIDSSSSIGIYGQACGSLRIGNCTISNKATAISFSDSDGYALSITGTNNSVGITSGGCSIVRLINIYITATTRLYQSTGGAFINQNGTQISGLITSGLSCTWGTIEAGGYYRNGNLSGVAQVIVNLRITTTAPLTVGQQYSIGGFPTYGGHPIVAVTVHNLDATAYCYLNNLGFLIFAPKTNISSGFLIIFTCTYITN